MDEFEVGRARPDRATAFAHSRGYVRLRVGARDWGMKPSIALGLAADLIKAVADLRVIDDATAKAAMTEEARSDAAEGE